MLFKVHRSRLVDISPWFATQIGTPKDLGQDHLPPGWAKVVVTGGKTIYVNAETNEVTGVRPTSAVLMARPDSAVSQAESVVPLQDVTPTEFTTFLSLLYSR